MVTQFLYHSRKSLRNFLLLVFQALTHTWYFPRVIVLFFILLKMPHEVEAQYDLLSIICFIITTEPIVRKEFYF